MRIGITGLARAGKTALLTSPAANLLAVSAGRPALPPRRRARLRGRRNIRRSAIAAFSGQGMHTVYRSYGARHASEYAPWANANIIVCVSIESLEGLDNVEAIAAVESIDMIGLWPLGPQCAPRRSSPARPPDVQGSRAPDRGGLQRARETCPRVCGNRGADRGVLAAWVQGVEPARYRRQHLSRWPEDADRAGAGAAQIDRRAGALRRAPVTTGVRYRRQSRRRRGLLSPVAVQDARAEAAPDRSVTCNNRNYSCTDILLTNPQKRLSLRHGVIDELGIVPRRAALGHGNPRRVSRSRSAPVV
jgi:hypothetical protein